MDSPEYDCQFVFVVNDTAVFHARSGATLAIFCGFHGSHSCTRSITYSNTSDTPLKSSIATPYSFQTISFSSSTPPSR